MYYGWFVDGNSEKLDYFKRLKGQQIDIRVGTMMGIYKLVSKKSGAVYYTILVEGNMLQYLCSKRLSERFGKGPSFFKLDM